MLEVLLEIVLELLFACFTQWRMRRRNPRSHRYAERQVYDDE